MCIRIRVPSSIITSERSVWVRSYGFKHGNNWQINRLLLNRGKYNACGVVVCPALLYCSCVVGFHRARTKTLLVSRQLCRYVGKGQSENGYLTNCPKQFWEIQRTLTEKRHDNETCFSHARFRRNGGKRVTFLTENIRYESLCSRPDKAYSGSQPTTNCHFENQDRVNCLWFPREIVRKEFTLPAVRNSTSKRFYKSIARGRPVLWKHRFFFTTFKHILGFV